MILQVIDSTDGKFLGREVEVVELEELSTVFEEDFTDFLDKGDHVVVRSSNFMIKLKKI